MLGTEATRIAGISENQGYGRILFKVRCIYGVKADLLQIWTRNSEYLDAQSEQLAARKTL